MYIFYSCSKKKIYSRNGMVRKRSQMQLANSNSLGDFMTLKKASSCSTIYIDDSTVSQPNLKNTIKCVSLAIYYHIKNRKSDGILDIFDEKKSPLTVRIYFKVIDFYCNRWLILPIWLIESLIHFQPIWLIGWLIN